MHKNPGIYVSITGEKPEDGLSKLKELARHRISKACLFPTRWDKEGRDKVYDAIAKSRIREIPLLHVRDDMELDEIRFFYNHYNTRYFTIHEDHFNVIDRWKGMFQHLYLEMNFDNYVAKDVDVRRIAGFCIDLSHFKTEEERWTVEFDYVLHERKIRREFGCNHLNGFNPYKLRDKHVVTDLKDFNYLNTLPDFVFGDVIAIETDNPIEDQLVFQKHVMALLEKKLNR